MAHPNGEQINHILAILTCIDKEDLAKVQEFAKQFLPVAEQPADTVAEEPAVAEEPTDETQGS